MNNWKVWLENLDIKPYSALGLFILLALPITLMLVFRSQNNRSSAATPDKLEAEGGTLSSTGVSKQTDTGASGGSYVLFNKLVASPTPISTDPWSVPFGTRPLSGPLSYNGNCPPVIENKTFKDLGANIIAIRIVNCTNVTIRAVDFINVSEGVYAVNSQNITLKDSRYQNITGPYERVGLNRGNLIQLDNIQGGLIAHNKDRCGDTEDIVSVYKSSNIIVEDNHFEGVYTSSSGCLAWRSNSGTGAISGDYAGTGNVIRRNILVNVGQVGTAIAGGTNNRIENNIIIGQQRISPASNVGIYVLNFGGGVCANNIVTGNKVRYVNSTGNPNGWYTDSSCTGTIQTGNNFNDTTLNIENYRVQN